MTTSVHGTQAIIFPELQQGKEKSASSRRPYVTPPPAAGTGENKVQKSGMFSATQNVSLSHHNNHAFHHNFTTKHHHENTLFPEYPSKNAQ
jgi:hypothetical protein